MGTALESPDAKNKLEDLSGVVLKPGDNPYSALIEACDDDPAEIQSLYAAHRAARNAQQRAKFLADDFPGLLIDPFLLRLEDPSVEPGFADPRYCLVFWARPPEHVLRLAAHLQRLLKEVAPNLWLMPTHRMHMTTLEVTHSRTPAEADAIVRAMAPGIPAIANFTHTPAHRARLVRPLLSYDLAAVAVSFVPATSASPSASPPPVAPYDNDKPSRAAEADAYTYHHLRRDVFALARTTGVDIASRYVVPSAHITLGRFLSREDHATPEAREAWVRRIDEVNAWLEQEVWDRGPVAGAGVGGGEFVGEWIVGQERGLDARTGPLWYGGGRSIMVGEGF